MPPSYPITQVDGHSTIPDPEKYDGKSFAPFLIHHCRPIQPLHAFISMPVCDILPRLPVSVSHDLYCPSVRGDLEKRCYSTCGIYFSSVTRTAEYRRTIHSAPAAPARKVQHSQVEGGDKFTENYMDMLVPVVTFKIIPESTWIELE
ncbi:unnamed protein product [Euphydryas editha]|uniref:C2H2-type domain-containing protein n=1 Tax=Euphydryas editha TaxID=104508 RepID=A0AAU9VB81_EUPED|nr:unnamed protein product [Euphydryas editha]